MRKLLTLLIFLFCFASLAPVLHAQSQTLLIPFDQCTPGESANAGNSYWTVIGFTNWDSGNWQFVLNTNADVFCSIRIPNNVSGSPNASVVIDLAANEMDGNTHTSAFSTCDNITTSLNLQVGSLTCQSSQNYVASTTAYSNTELTFAVNATIVANQILVVKIHQASGGGNTANVNMSPPKLKINALG